MNRLLNSMSEHPIAQVQIAYLADIPELVPLLAEWHHHQWRHLAGARTLEERKARLVHHLQRNAIPTTFVAWQKDQPLGSASLVANDMDVLPEWIPWLANVFVLPDYRRQGIGAMLVQRVATEAANLGYPRLYLYTLDQMHLYETLGWHVLHQRPYRGHDMTVMARDLIVNPPPAVEEPLPTPAQSATI
jgi:GNAT superfamily N-acetyltransferase